MIPVIGFVGFSGSGKTTLIEKLLPLLKPEFAAIAVIKATHHAIELDQPGKDSYRYRESGADLVVLASANATQLWQRQNQQSESLPSIIAKLQNYALDLILFEGYKNAAFDKIVVYRSAMGDFNDSLVDPHCFAIACDEAANLNNILENTNISRLDINKPRLIADTIKSRIRHAKAHAHPLMPG